MRTFRFRLALYHILLVSGALTATFLIVLAVAHSAAVKSGQRHMAKALRQAQVAYLGGRQPEKTGQLPEAILERIGSELPGFSIGSVEQELQPGGYLYEVVGSTGSEWMEVLADPAGPLWVAGRKPLREVFGEVALAVQEADMPDLALFIYSPDGALLQGPPERALPPAGVAAMLKAVERGEPWADRKGSHWLGGMALFDGNIVCVSSRMDELLSLSRWSGDFLALLMVVFIPLSGWIGFHVSQRAMAGVQRVTQAANRVGAGNFSERVPRGAEGAEIEDLAASFNTMVARVDILMRELREVTGNIAHDLRTPIARIRGMLESMDWAEVSPEERTLLAASAIEECDRIMPLIESVLELSRAEAGVLVLQEEPFDLAAEVRTAHSMFMVIAEDRHVSFDCFVPDAPVPMVGDRRRMQRIIANLVDNALKFSPEGGRVSLELQCDGQQAVLKIRDDGPGIPANELDRVFERFYRVDSSRSTPGHGLGLSMVNAFAKALGGSVSIESAPGQGCVATVVVPLRRTPHKAAPGV